MQLVNKTNDFKDEYKHWAGFYQQVKFTRPLTLEDCGCPVLLTNLLVQLRVRRQPINFVCYIRFTYSRTKIYFDGASRHDKHDFWHIHANGQSVLQGWKINLETKICGREWNLSNTFSWLVFTVKETTIWFVFFNQKSFSFSCGF